MTKVNFALVPVGATHYDFLYKAIYWLKYDQTWHYFDDSRNSWVIPWQEEPANKKEIPVRERELNRLAEESAWQLVSMQCKNETWNLTKAEWQQRRAERIEAGLIEVDNPVVLQAKDMLKRKNVAAANTLNALGYTYHGGEQWKPPIGKAPEYIHEIESKAQWMPEVGEECEASWLLPPDGGSPEWVKGTFKGEFDGLCWFGCFEEVVLSVNAIEFRPIKTPEQKEKEAFIKWFESIERGGINQPLSISFYNCMTLSGVDLTPILNGQTK